MRFGYENFFDPIKSMLTVDSPSTRKDVLFCEEAKPPLWMPRAGLFGFSNHTTPATNNFTGSSSPITIETAPSGSHPNGINHLSSPDLTAFCFKTSIDRLTEEDIDKLGKLYDQTGGNLPSRRKLKAVSDTLGVAQCKIKRWFENQKDLENNTRTRLHDGAPALQCPQAKFEAILKEAESHHTDIIVMNKEVSDILERLKT